MNDKQYCTTLERIKDLKRKHKDWTLLDCAMFLMNRSERYTDEWTALEQIVDEYRSKQYITKLKIAR